eukprot:gnl/TRDRNA2_/TRDRNA2_167069_c0_seq1.p1 gnl/TRDRNA2_/TRDRNA2_167069_c0~~gnl/TRDRNA2_/TRDRNA2_167069_c0_seq1.p1  ORF type:complete len:580 (+),score=78.47 gnl/TRDRNA2_/TRDRNA2_167069_c0_seq1:181-1920(+)
MDNHFDFWDYFIFLNYESSEVAPERSDSYTLAPDEKVLFYQRSQFPSGISKDQNEVVVTATRVILTRTKILKAPKSLILQQEQIVRDTSSIKGYDSALVAPSIWDLIKYIIVLLVALHILTRGPTEVVNAGMTSAIAVLDSDIVQLFGGPCRHIGLCTQKASEGLKAVQGSILLQVPEELPRSTMRKAASSMSQMQFLTVTSRGKTSRGRKRHSSMSTVPVTAVHGCADFPGWKDRDEDGCSKYAMPDWSLSCVPSASPDGGKDEQLYEERRDSTALRLSPREACCICGGGETAAREVAIERLTEDLWPVLLAESGRDPSELAGVQNATITAIALFAASGKDALTGALGLMPSSYLQTMGRQMAQLSTVSIVAGVSQLPAQFSELLLQLQEHMQKNMTALAKRTASFATSVVGQLASGNDSPIVVEGHPLTAAVTAASNLALQHPFIAGVSSLGGPRGIIEKVKPYFAVTLGAVVHAKFLLLCLFRIALILTMLWCLLGIRAWKYERFAIARIYVFLHCPLHDREFFPGSIPVKPAHGIDMHASFYIPADNEAPNRLKDFGAALLAATREREAEHAHRV